MCKRLSYRNPFKNQWVPPSRNIAFFVVLSALLLLWGSQENLTYAQATDAKDFRQALYEQMLKSVLKRTQQTIMQEQRGGGTFVGGGYSRRNILGALGLSGRTQRSITLSRVIGSLKLTIEGGILYGTRNDLAEAETLLRQAIEKYPDNALAYLLLGDVTGLLGKRNEAIQAYVDFWEGASRRDRLGLMRLLFTKNDAIIVAEHVKSELARYGAKLPAGAQAENLPLLLEMSSGPESLPRLIVSIGIPVALVVGILLMIIRRFAWDETPVETDRFIYQVYSLLVVAYLFWMAHLFFGMPPLFATPEWEVITIVVAGTLGFVGWNYFSKVRQYEREKRDPDTVFCPYCKKSVLKMVLVCPFCNQRIQQNP